MGKVWMFSVVFILLSNAVYAETILATVNGLVCSFCATGIEKILRKQAAVAEVKVDLDHKLVTVNTKPGETLDDATLTTLLTDAGYSVTNISRQH